MSPKMTIFVLFSVCFNIFCASSVATRSIIFIAPPTRLETYYDEMKPILFDFYADFINIVNTNNSSETEYILAIVDNYGENQLTKRGINSKNILVSSDYELSDIWIRDFGTVQVDDTLYKFVYSPDYLLKHKSQQIDTDYRLWLDNNKIGYVNISIILDGGNFVFERNTKKLIVTTRILDDNPSYNKAELIEYLKETMNINEIAIIPEAKDDTTGHADGMVTFINNNIIGINNYTWPIFEKQLYSEIITELYNAFGENNIEIMNLPYDPTLQRYKGFWSAKGIYTNVLTGLDTFYSPKYNISNDDIQNINILEQYSSNNVNVKGVNAEDVSIMGGSVRCLTWYIWGTVADQFIKTHNISQT